ncbi:MAG: TIR domain-containing protein, partial [Ktedonobacteraceae bacterium]|nr:TIR domain-containing protein [Ktedonobacteraceae bacterium]
MGRAKAYQYEIVISYAGEDRLYADELVAALNRRGGVKLWYAEYEQHVTWGKDLYTYLSDLYQNKARYCVAFFSKHYARKAWTRHELAAAQARAFEENKEYILPIRLDDTKIPGVLATTHYISWPPTADYIATADYVADQIVKKLGKPAYTPPPSSQLVAIPAVTVAPIVTHKDLAARMAQLTHSIRDLILQAFERNAASDTLQDLYEAFKDILLPDLSPAEFADMFAQTLAYGLFAARYNHKSGRPFGRLDAAREIPKTNPFLRKLFGTIAGPDIDDEPFIGLVDELAQVLAVTDMDAALADFGKRTRQQDPVVHFYETFLAQYDPRLRELRGVYYTPEPVISYIVQSVHALLRTEFGCGEDGLADISKVKQTTTNEYGETVTQDLPRVMILDPACGTGAFLSAVIRVIRERYEQIGNAGMWSSYVCKQLLPRIFGFELLMAPYAMAHLNLSMQL